MIPKEFKTKDMTKKEALKEAHFLIGAGFVAMFIWMVSCNFVL